jgi:ribose 5-phosphate isomerase RpiB
MTRDEQRTFVHDLTTAVARSIMENIENGSIPHTWDGIELRMLLAEKFGAEAARCTDIMGRKRMKEYRNDVIVRNL